MHNPETRNNSQLSCTCKYLLDFDLTSTRVCMKEHSGLQCLWRNANAPEQCKNSKLTSNTHWAIPMMFIYKITEVHFVMSMRKYHDVTIAINDAAPYIPC